MRIDITEKNMVWLVEHKMADTIVTEFHRKETVIESLIRERDEARAEVKRLEAEPGDGWVLWEDYERLRTEVERLRASSFVTAVPSDDYEKLKADLEKSDAVVFTQAVENERLKAEVERLRKAGDEVAQRYLTAYQIDLRNGPHTPQSVVEWNAAKEGKQS